MTEQSPQRKKTYIILFAILASVILYLAGVFSGLYANKILKESTDKDIYNLKEKTSKEKPIEQPSA